ncbi:MAG TPA: hypothetical protein VD866_15175 [Urbifossiella sp.]|nr:hypothetical protein [Urbifossiella sp.]
MSSSLLLPLFAQAAPKAAGTPWDRPELLTATLAIAGALLAGGVVIYLVDRWRKSGAATADAAAELTGFRGMLERGEITEEEYARLRGKAAAKMKGAPAAETTSPTALDTAASPPAPPTPPVPGPLPDDYFDDPQPPPRPT